MAAPLFALTARSTSLLETAAPVTLRASRHPNCTPLQQYLHWLPISERIKYKTVCMCYNAITAGSAPLYLSELLYLYGPYRCFRSSSGTCACANSNASNAKPVAFTVFAILHFLTLRSPHLEQSLPRHQALCYSLFLQKHPQDFLFSKYFT